MKRNLLFTFFIFFISLNSHAFKFSPMSASVGIKDGKNSTLFYLENDSEQPIAVTASLLTREINIDGVESNKKIAGELSIYPSQLIIPANEKRSVKVTWTGKMIPQSELSYRLIAEQLPIELDKNKKQKASIKVLLRYVAALYVAPEEFSSSITLKKMDVREKEKDVSFLIANSGKKHQVLSSLKLEIVGKKSIELSGEELKGMSGENVLALSERVFRFPRVGKFKDIHANDKVKIDFEEN